VSRHAAARSTSVSRTSGFHRSSSMLGSAVSSNKPTDFQPSWVIWHSSFPLTKPHGFTPGPTSGWPYKAVGMHSAVHSSIGLVSMPVSESWMVGLATPAAVSSRRMVPPGVLERVLGRRDAERRGDSRTAQLPHEAVVQDVQRAEEQNGEGIELAVERRRREIHEGGDRREVADVGN